MAEKEPAKHPKPATLPDAFSLFRPSVAALRLNLETFITLIVLPLGLLFGGMVLFGAGLAAGSPVAILLALIIAAGVVTGLILSMAIIVAVVESAKGNRIAFTTSVREGLRYFWRLFGLLLISGLIVIVGFMLLIVPGIFALQRLLLAPYILVDKNIGIKEAIRESFRFGRKFSGAVWGVLGVLLLINLISLVPFIGWLVSSVLGIMYLCAPAIRYLQIRSR